MRARASTAIRPRVLGPDQEPLNVDDLRRLFPGEIVLQTRADRLVTWPRIVAACDQAVVGVATYQRTDEELRVCDLGVDGACSCSVEDIVNVLFNALESACLAGGGRRMVVLPHHMADERILYRRGYTPIREGCAGSWLQKTLIAPSS